MRCCSAPGLGSDRFPRPGHYVSQWVCRRSCEAGTKSRHRGRTNPARYPTNTNKTVFLCPIWCKTKFWILFSHAHTLPVTGPMQSRSSWQWRASQIRSKLTSLDSKETVDVLGVPGVNLTFCAQQGTGRVAFGVPRKPDLPCVPIPRNIKKWLSLYSNHQEHFSHLLLTQAIDYIQLRLYCLITPF